MEVKTDRLIGLSFCIAWVIVCSMMVVLQLWKGQPFLAIVWVLITLMWYYLTLNTGDLLWNAGYSKGLDFSIKCMKRTGATK